jgi:cell division protein ZapA
MKKVLMERVQVEIFGHQYSIKGQEDPEYIRELASFVDSKMREVQKGTGTADPHRVAILTALMISDELHRLRHVQVENAKSVDERLRRLLDITRNVK